VFFQISHTTIYRYDRPVFLEPHALRLRPRCDASQHLIDFALEIEPEPAGSSFCNDLEGNVVCELWFEGSTESLFVKAVSKVKTLRRNPFDYIFLDPVAELLPVTYPDALKAGLMPHIVRSRCGKLVDRFAAAVATEVNWKTLRFLSSLNRQIHESFRQVIREKDEPQLPEETLLNKQGSCRDLALLFIDACRSLGIAARFVSGYEEGEAPPEKRELHAWAEVYLPGGGWRGYDPTRGLAVADRHIALAAAAAPLLAAPITGTFRGTGAEAKMQATIEIAASPDR
jgi:transglutaminase-like putative cysteine protease